MERALVLEDVELAKRIANRPSDTNVKKQLWYQIAGHVVRSSAIPKIDFAIEVLLTWFLVF